MTLAEEMQQRQEAASELERVTAIWKEAVQVERDKFAGVIIAARRAKDTGIPVRLIVDVTGVSRSSLYTAEVGDATPDAEPTE